MRSMAFKVVTVSDLAQAHTEDGAFKVEGFSAYKDVVLLWDSYFNDILQSVVDMFDTLGLLTNLSAVYKTKARITCFWCNEIPDNVPVELELLGDEYPDHVLDVLYHTTDHLNTEFRYVQPETV